MQVLAIVGFAAVLSGCGAHAVIGPGRTIKKSLFGPFAGFVWSGHVRQVGGVVVVPRILSRSPLGAAGTWIGARGAVDLRTDSGPFFQIGVGEWRGTPHGGRVKTLYFAFWSSSALGFYPRVLFRVHPGDSVHLAMTLRHGYWRMVATDPAARRRRMVMAATGNAGFEQADWFQENPATNDAGAQAPYPELDVTRFARVEVNSSVPSARSMMPLWMSTGIGTFGPNRFLDGMFVVRAVHPSATDIRYQEIVFDLNYAAAVYDHELMSWTGPARRSEIKTASKRFARALQLNARRFRDSRWPGTADRLVSRLVAATLNTRTIVLHIATASASELTHARASYMRSVRQIQRADLRLKSCLHIPLSGYSGPYVRTPAS